MNLIELQYFESLELNTIESNLFPHWFDYKTYIVSYGMLQFYQADNFIC
jgi:hypothetical protein